MTVNLSVPFDRFRRIYERAQALPREFCPDPNAMALATVGADGRPSNRIVLLKGFDERGFVFYTNLDSRKGTELRGNPWAALCFHWAPLESQIRVEGSAEPVSDADADAYFASRARGSQLGAWASPQSRPVESDGELERRVSEAERSFENGPVPRPPHWSGFRVVPDTIEFWTNRPSRLHDRALFVREGDGWRVVTLYP